MASAQPALTLNSQATEQRLGAAVHADDLQNKFSRPLACSVQCDQILQCSHQRIGHAATNSSLQLHLAVAEDPGQLHRKTCHAETNHGCRVDSYHRVGGVAGLGQGTGERVVGAKDKGAIKRSVVIGVLAELKSAASMLHAGSPTALRHNVSGIQRF